MVTDGNDVDPNIDEAIVLILIVMEDGHWPHEEFRFQSQQQS